MKLTSDQFRVADEKKTFESNSSWRIFEAKVELPNGNIATWSYVDEVDYVVAVPLLPNGNVIMKKEYRLSRKEVILELPSGKIEPNKKRDIITEINREMQEEINMKANKLHKLITFHPWNHANFKIHVFLAQDLKMSSAQPDENEIIEVISLPFSEALSYSLNNNANAQTIIGLLLAKQYIEKK